MVEQKASKYYAAEEEQIMKKVSNLKYPWLGKRDRFRVITVVAAIWNVEHF
jgi:hypothetical protein